MGKVDEKVLTFFVSGALLAGTAGCSKNKKQDEPKTNTGQHEMHVNPGPAIDAGGAAEPADLEPVRVNTRKIEDPVDAGAGAEPEPVPKPKTNPGPRPAPPTSDKP